MSSHCATAIKPKCIENGKISMPFLEINGIFLPCCWIGSSPNRIKDLKLFLGNDFDKMNIKNSSLKEIKEVWDKISQTWETPNPYHVCNTVCGKTSINP